MELKDVIKGMRVRVCDRSNQYDMHEGIVLSVMHELIPDTIHIRLQLDSGEVIPGFKPDQLDWE